MTEIPNISWAENNESQNNFSQILDEKLNFWVDIPREITDSYDNEIEKINTQTITEAERFLPEIRLEVYWEVWWLASESLNSIVYGKIIELPDINDSNTIWHDEFLEHENRLAELEEKLPALENVIYDSEWNIDYESYNGPLSPELEEYITIWLWLDKAQVISEELTLIRNSSTSYINRETFEEQNSWEVYNFSEHSPTRLIAEKYKDRSEEDKILLLQNLWEVLWSKYDHSLLENPEAQWISTEQMWDDLSSWENSWICGDIHKEILRLWKELWLEGELISGNSWTWGHLIVRGKRENWKYYLIDYGKYIEGETQDQVTDAYHMNREAISTSSISSDENWKITWKTQTELQKETAKRIYISRDTANNNQDWIDVKLWWTWEFSLKYSKSFWNTQLYAYTDRMEAYKTQDFMWVWAKYESESRELWFQWTYAALQKSKAFSGYYTEKGNISSLDTYAGITAWASYNPNWEIGDGFVDLYAWVKKDGYHIDINASIVSKNLWDNDIKVDKLTLIPEVTAGYDWETYFFWGKVSATKESVDIWRRTNWGEINAKVIRTRSGIDWERTTTVWLDSSWLVWKWTFKIWVEHSDWESSWKISYSQKF